MAGMTRIPSAPRQASTSALVAAIRPSFDTLVDTSNVSVGAAAGAELPQAFEVLARQAEGAGWNYQDAVEAIRELARERLGAAGATFD